MKYELTKIFWYGIYVWPTHQRVGKGEAMDTTVGMVIEIAIAFVFFGCAIYLKRAKKKKKTARRKVVPSSGIILASTPIVYLDGSENEARYIGPGRPLDTSMCSSYVRTPPIEVSIVFPLVGMRAKVTVVMELKVKVSDVQHFWWTYVVDCQRFWPAFEDRVRAALEVIAERLTEEEREAVYALIRDGDKSGLVTKLKERAKKSVALVITGYEVASAEIVHSRNRGSTADAANEVYPDVLGRDRMP